MADEKSREERIDELLKDVIRNRDGEALSRLNALGVTVEFTDEGVRWREVNTLGKALESVGSHTESAGVEIAKSIGSIAVKIDVDVSEALTGLKAVQREAREATKALRELEAESQKSVTVYDLQAQAIKDDLKRRGDKGANTALLLIEEQEQAIAELERHISDKSITDDIRRSYE